MTEIKDAPYPEIYRGHFEILKMLCQKNPSFAKDLEAKGIPMQTALSDHGLTDALLKNDLVLARKLIFMGADLRPVMIASLLNERLFDAALQLKEFRDIVDVHELATKGKKHLICMALANDVAIADVTPAKYHPNPECALVLANFKKAAVSANEMKTEMKGNTPVERIIGLLSPLIDSIEIPLVTLFKSDAEKEIIAQNSSLKKKQFEEFKGKLIQHPLLARELLKNELIKSLENPKINPAYLRNLVRLNWNFQAEPELVQGKVLRKGG